MARKTHQHYADDFGVSENTFRRWLKSGAPYQNEAKMITWLNAQQRKTPAVRAWLKQRGVKPIPKKAAILKKIKAKTAEGLGPVGQGLSAEAHAAALISRPEGHDE